MCLFSHTNGPVFEVKFQNNVSVPSDVINRPKSIDIHYYDFDLWSFLHRLFLFGYFCQNEDTCLFSRTNCPVFEVKFKINVSVPSDVINRPRSFITLYTLI